MGIEAFQVRLKGGSATFAEADAAVRVLPYARPDGGFLRDCVYYTAGDGSLIVEIEVCPRPVEISCRFAVCQPPAVDAVLVELTRRLMAATGMAATIVGETRAEHSGWFGTDCFAEFAAAIPEYAGERREDWVRAVGPEQFPATTAAAMQHVIERWSAPRPASTATAG